MLHVLVRTLFLFVLAELFAVMEIETEGKYGWAEKFPTWYRMRGGLIVKAYVAFNHKPLTGYHAALFPVPLLIFIYPMVDSGHFAWAGLVGAIATYCAFAPVWDYSWFVLNPHYGIKEFRPNMVWWFGHEPWMFGRIPSSYIAAWTGSLVLATISGALSGGWVNSLSHQALQLGCYLVLAMLLAVFGAPAFKRYYERMRLTDQREQAGIYHSNS